MSLLGSTPLTPGTLYIWQVTVTKDGATWDLSAETVNFHWRRADGSTFQQLAAGTNLGVCTYTDTIPQLDTTQGNAWALWVEVVGKFQSPPIGFEVVDP